jgi:hypothetical protein
LYDDYQKIKSGKNMKCRTLANASALLLLASQHLRMPPGLILQTFSMTVEQLFKSQSHERLKNGRRTLMRLM